jgi:hypothetical protein
MDETQMAEVITYWLTQAEILENYASGIQREELHAFVEHAVKVLDLLGQAELVKDASGLSASIEAEFEALKKRAVRLGLAQGS